MRIQEKIKEIKINSKINTNFTTQGKLHKTSKLTNICLTVSTQLNRVLIILAKHKLNMNKMRA